MHLRQWGALGLLSRKQPLLRLIWTEGPRGGVAVSFSPACPALARGPERERRSSEKYPTAPGEKARRKEKKWKKLYFGTSRREQ